MIISANIRESNYCSDSILRNVQLACVFEGFFDFLSYLVLQRKQHPIAQDTQYDCIVLNSTSLVHKAIPFIQVYEHAYCYLDNDQSGKKAFNDLAAALPIKSVNQLSVKNAAYNDLNDYWRSKDKCWK